MKAWAVHPTYQKAVGAAGLETSILVLAPSLSHCVTLDHSLPLPGSQFPYLLTGLGTVRITVVCGLVAQPPEAGLSESVHRERGSKAETGSQEEETLELPLPLPRAGSSSLGPWLLRPVGWAEVRLWQGAPRCAQASQLSLPLPFCACEQSFP